MGNTDCWGHGVGYSWSITNCWSSISLNGPKEFDTSMQWQRNNILTTHSSCQSWGSIGSSGVSRVRKWGSSASHSRKGEERHDLKLFRKFYSRLLSQHFTLHFRTEFRTQFLFFIFFTLIMLLQILFCCYLSEEVQRKNDDISGRKFSIYTNFDLKQSTHRKGPQLRHKLYETKGITP